MVVDILCYFCLLNAYLCICIFTTDPCLVGAIPSHVVQRQETSISMKTFFVKSCISKFEASSGTIVNYYDLPDGASVLSFLTHSLVLCHSI